MIVSTIFLRPLLRHSSRASSSFGGIFADLIQAKVTKDEHIDPEVHNKMKAVQYPVVYPFRNGCASPINKIAAIIRSPRYLTATSFARLISEIDTFIFDADGVLWLGNEAIPGSADLLRFLIAENKCVIVLTNNATKSRANYAKKLATLGFPEEINQKTLVNPAAVVADLLSRSGIAQSGKKIYLIGEQGIRDELDQVGIEYFGHGPDLLDKSNSGPFIFDMEFEEKIDDVGAVVVGYEKHFNYPKLMRAANYLKNPDTLFVATNEDETCPGPDPDIIVPDAGPIVAAVKYVVGRDPITVGKPCSPAFDYICRRWKVDPYRTLMVGDRTNTDVKFGRMHGLKTMLVLSGCHQIDDVRSHQDAGHFDMVPDFCAPSLGSLVPKTRVECPLPDGY